MIVVSGVLVLVALIFLIIGLLGEGLAMIWLSIGTSVVAGVFLLLGALQRRSAPAPAAAEGTTGQDMLDRVTAVSVRPREADAIGSAPTEAISTAAASSGSAGEVSVVPGRPRYHVANCRFLAGRPDVETIPVVDARGEGYTACGVCKPDAALEAAAAMPEPEPEAEADLVAADATAEDIEPAAATPAKKAPAKKATTRTTATTAAAAKPAKKAAEKAAPAAKAAPAKATAAQVVVIPDRGKFHVETCRFVKGVPGTVNLTKATAKRQGYAPCGVCKP